MGSDDLHHKRKARAAKDLTRRKAARAPYEKVLIVCEGQKTEPYYFNDLKDHYGLNSANVEICGDCGSDPLSILTYAKQKYREEKDAGDPFDRVYCVFDKDSHGTYDQVLDEAARVKPKDTFFVVTSVPCFEYWLLLHFTYRTKPYAQLPANSPGDQVIRDLKNYIPDYEKCQKGLFTQLIEQLNFAKSNADRALTAARRCGTDNPTTHIHQLVEYLQRIKHSENG